MKKSLRKYLILIVGILLIVSLVITGLRIYNYRQGDRIYSDALEVAGIGESTSETESVSEESSSEEVSSEIAEESEA